MRFRPDQHLRRQQDFKAAREQGRRIDVGAFTVWWLKRPLAPEAAPAGESSAASPLPLPRVGVVASTSAVGGAVARNRAKRRLRAIFRHHQQLVPPGSDVLLVARTAVNRIPYLEVEQKFIEACRRIAPAKTT